MYLLCAMAKRRSALRRSQPYETLKRRGRGNRQGPSRGDHTWLIRTKLLSVTCSAARSEGRVLIPFIQASQTGMREVVDETIRKLPPRTGRNGLYHCVTTKGGPRTLGRRRQSGCPGCRVSEDRLDFNNELELSRDPKRSWKARLAAISDFASGHNRRWAADVGLARPIFSLCCNKVEMSLALQS
jgi:hypothetical protein